MRPASSSGSDLIDQILDWFRRQKDRLLGDSDTGRDARPSGRAGSRREGRHYSQAVPMGSAAARSGVHHPARDRRRAGAASLDRNTFTMIFAGVLLLIVIALFFVLSWALSSGGPWGSPVAATASPAPGTQLPGPAPLSSPPPFIVASPSPTIASTAIPPTPQVHTVAAGDTLAAIARRYGVTVDAIVQANNFTDRNRILRIGERLIIPQAPAGSPVPR